MDERLEEVTRLLEIIDRLRAEDGCPWDREQTLDTLVPHMQEETAELADAIAAGAPAPVAEELGDVLMNVFLMGRVGEQENRFTMAEVARGISDKLVRRHPHVFGDVVAENPDQVLVNWERIKKEEKQDANGGEEERHSLMDGIPAAASALRRVVKQAQRAASVGFDWPDAKAAFLKVREELEEVDVALERHGSEPGDGAEPKVSGGSDLEHEIGDLLFAIVCAARLAGVDGDLALRRACQRFDRRFRHVEAALGDRLQDASLDEMERHWQEAKGTEGSR